MAELEEVFRSPDFRALSVSDKIGVLNEMDSDFRALPESDKTAIIAQSIGAPVLREQPGALRRTFGPGGIASPENVGIIGGATLGGAVGGPAGALAGATVGGVIGKTSELLLDPGGPQAGTSPRVTPEGKSFLEASQEIAEAGTRGFLAEGGGATNIQGWYCNHQEGFNRKG